MDVVLFFDMKIRTGPQDQGYFKLNVWGMQMMRQIMDDAGVLDWETDVIESDFPTEIPAEPRERERVLKEIDDLLSIQSPDPTKVPATKFCTNDQWIVTENECRIISEAIDRYIESLPDNWLVTDPNSGEQLTPEETQKILEVAVMWSAYNEKAAKYGGYIVG